MSFEWPLFSDMRDIVGILRNTNSNSAADIMHLSNMTNVINSTFQPPPHRMSSFLISP